MTTTVDTSMLTALGNFSLRNKVINGEMLIAQRGTSFAAAASGTFGVDRFVYEVSSDAVVTVSQQADAPSNNEFQNSLRVAVTTADASLAAGQVVFINHRFEGFNVRDLIGRTFTLSFWVRSSKTGVHCLALVNSGGDRSYVAEYTINAANTWEYKTITVSGGLITAGTWNWTNGLGLQAMWCMGSGSTFHTTAGAWQTGNFRATANQVNCLDTIGNIFAITGVQLEVGAVATPFEHRHYGMELGLCQRYYYRNAPASAGAALSIGMSGQSSTVANALVQFPAEMRVPPTAVEQSGSAADYELVSGAAAIQLSAVPAFNSATRSITRLDLTVASGLAAGQSGWLRAKTTSGYLGWSAEL